MEYIDSINIFGKEYKPNSCIVLNKVPDKDTPGLVGMFAMNVNSESKKLYKCIASAPGAYEWVPLGEGGGGGNTSAEVVTDLKNVQNPDEFTDYYLIVGDRYYHYRWNEDRKVFVDIGKNVYTQEEVDEKISSTKSDLLTNSINPIRKDLGYPPEGEENTENLFNRMSNIEDLVSTLGEGDNENLKIKYENNVLYLYEEGNEESPLGSVEIVGGGGGSAQTSQYTLRITSPDEEKKSRVIQKGSPVEINYIVSLFTKDDNDPEVDILTEDNVTMYLYVKEGAGNFVLEKTWVETANGKAHSLDISEYFTMPGKKSIKLSAAHKEQVGDEGATVITTASTKQPWIINAIDFSLSASPDFDKTPYYTDTVEFAYSAKGTVNKTLCYQINNEEIREVPLGSLALVSDRLILNTPYHGAYSLTVWCKTILDDEEVTTNKLYYEFIRVVRGNYQPIIRLLVNPEIEATQYSQIPYSYTVYTGGAEKTVTITEGDRTFQRLVSNLATYSYNFTPEMAGEQVISISCPYDGNPNIEKSVTVQVASFPYEVLPVTRGLELDFNPRGRTNSDENYDEFKYISATNKEYDWELSDNFDWRNGGWKEDEEGNSYFCIKAGTSATFNYALFDDSGTIFTRPEGSDEKIAGKGKEFKIIFKTTNVKQRNAKWLECKGLSDLEQTTGIQMNANEGYVYHSGSEALKIPYSENDIIEFDMNITPFYATDTSGVSVVPMILTYEDGTPVQPSIIKSDNVDFKIKEKTYITIGSEFCDVHLYRMKAYSGYLTEKEILKNFIADARTGLEKASRFIRNEIYNSDGILTPASVAEACPDLRVITITAPRFTNDKKDKVPGTTIEMIYKNGDPVLDNWIATDCKHSGQGTTSNEYAVSGRNINLYLEDGIVKYGENRVSAESLSLPEGKITLTRKSVPAHTLNIKVNIASSENANNSLLQKRYDRYLPYEPYSQTRYSEKDGEGKYLIDIKNTMEFYNCVVFIKETGEKADGTDETRLEFNDSEYHFYAIGNIGDSKDTDNTRASDPTDENEFCLEIADWNRPLSAFPVDTMVDIRFPVKDKKPFLSLYEKGKLPKSEVYEKSGNEYIPTNDETLQDNKDYYVDALKWEDLSGDITYEFRYILDDENSTMLNNAYEIWKNFYNFVIRDFDENYTEADWRKEFREWFIYEAAAYYYFFTLRYTMVDNRAKNSFWHYGKTGIIRPVSHPVQNMLQVYYEKVNTEEGAEKLKNLDGVEGFYKKVTDTEIVSGKEYYTQHAFDFWDYDNDTALGIDNAGKLEIDFGVEEQDADASGAYYFRAHNSTFFNRFVQLFSNISSGENIPNLETMFNNFETLNLNTFDSAHLISEFDDWQAQFPEELWRLDYERKYKRTYVGVRGDGDWDNAKPRESATRYLEDMMNGRKKYQRRQFEREQEAYISSKFVGSKAKSNTITLRGTNNVNASGDLNITPYSKIYLTVGNDTNGYYYHQRHDAGIPVEIEHPKGTSVDNIYIRSAKSISSLGDISSAYLQTADFGKAEKLKDALLGSNEHDGPLTSLGISATSNKLIEKIDITRLTSIDSLPLENFPSVKEFYAKGSGITTISFARNGLIEKAELPEVASITAKDLYNLNDLARYKREGDNYIENYQSLVGLTVNNCPNISQTQLLKMITEAAPYVKKNEGGEETAPAGSLRRLEVTDVNWTQETGCALATTDLLNALVELQGEREGSLPILTGTVEILGPVRVREIQRYREVWGGDDKLHLIFNSSEIVDQFEMTYWSGTSEEDPGEVVYRTYVDFNDNPPDPVALGLIDTPRKESTEQYDFVHIGWSDLSGIAGERNIYSVYENVIRKYTVTWKAFTGAASALQTTEVEYGTEAIYTGEIPKDERSENSGTYKIFTGWDKSTGFVRGNMTVHAMFQAGSAPTSKVQFNSLTPAQLKAMVKKGNVFSNYVSLKDYIDIALGHDFDFDNVDSEVLLEDRFLNKETYEPISKFTNQPIQLFNEDAPSFTLAIDYQMLGEGGTIASCYENDGAKGMIIKSLEAPVCLWGDKNVSFGTNLNRDIVVIRHLKGSRDLYVYASSLKGTDIGEGMVSIKLSRPTDFATDATLLFGGYKQSGMTLDLGKGNIFWSKIWYDDLGEDVAKKIALWPREIMRMEFCGDNKYPLVSDPSKTCTASFISNNLSSKKVKMNTNATNIGGWRDAFARRLVNNKMYSAIPIEWRQIIQQVKVPALLGNFSSTVTYTDDYLYYPSQVELASSSQGQVGYSNEGTTIPWISSISGDPIPEEAKRIRFIHNFYHFENPDTQYFYSVEDPTMDTSKTVKEGDLWNRGSGGSSYASYKLMYVSDETIERYGLNKASVPMFYKAESGEGGWTGAVTFFTRTAVVDSDIQFRTVYQAGYISSHHPNNFYNICLCFSI